MRCTVNECKHQPPTICVDRQADYAHWKRALNSACRWQGVTWTERPHPNWKPGVKQPNPWNSTNFETLDPNDMSGAEVYPLVRLIHPCFKHCNALGHQSPVWVLGAASCLSRRSMAGTHAHARRSCCSADFKSVHIIYGRYSYSQMHRLLRCRS